MKRSPHTPGPWYEGGTGNHQGLIASEITGANIAVTYNKQDAALIAAAPDLLEACQAALQTLQDPDNIDEQDAIDHLENAIHKATGE